LTVLSLPGWPQPQEVRNPRLCLLRRLLSNLSIAHHLVATQPGHPTNVPGLVLV